MCRPSQVLKEIEVRLIGYESRILSYAEMEKKPV